jgi:uncharacterized membrane protein
MSDELRVLYHISKSLVWGIVAILLSVLALIAFTLLLPFTLRSLVANSGQSQNQIAAIAVANEVRNLAGLASLLFILTIVTIFILIAVSIILGVFKSTPLKRLEANDAMRILEMRYAKGEITKEQFIEIKNTLGNRDASKQSD